MDVEILSIGTELLMGELVDTNAAYLAARMPALGLTVRAISQVGDSLDDLTQALAHAWQRVDVVVTTGGLGPTEDDLTRAAIARLLGEELRVDDTLAANLRSFLAARGREVSEQNLRQAQVIPSAQALSNPRGTAPGWWVEKGGEVIVALPGPPHEMEEMWENEVRPRLQRLATGAVILTRTLKTFGVPETSVNERISHLFDQGNPYLGIYAKADGIHLRIIGRGSTEEEAHARIAPMEEEIRRTLGSSLWGVDDETPEARLGDLLRTRHLTLATMESVTGGFLASSITDVPGSSAYFKGGFIAYTAAMKVALGVDGGLIAEHGVVSPQVAEAMAEAARRRVAADVGLGITGVAGPASMEDRPPGTVFIGFSFQGETRSFEGRYLPQRALVKRRAATQALLELYRYIAQRVEKPL